MWLPMVRRLADTNLVPAGFRYINRPKGRKLDDTAQDGASPSHGPSPKEGILPSATLYPNVWPRQDPCCAESAESPQERSVHREHGHRARGPLHRPSAAVVDTEKRIPDPRCKPATQPAGSRPLDWGSRWWVLCDIPTGMGPLGFR